MCHLSMIRREHSPKWAGSARRLSRRGARARIGAVVAKELHDLLLLGVRTLRAAGARRMHGEMESGRTLLAVGRVRTSAAFEETANGLRTSCANRAMQRSGARLVLLLDVRAGIEEELNH